MSKIDVSNIKIGAIATIQTDDVIYRLVVTEISDQAIKGRLDFSDSAYGSAVVTDFLERGCLVTIPPGEINDINIEENKELADSIFEDANKRVEYAETCIKGEGSIVQELIFTYDPEPMFPSSPVHLTVTQISTVDVYDSEGVPVMVKCWYFPENQDNVAKIFEKRKEYVSTDCRFLPETKVVFKQNEITSESILANAVCAEFFPKDIKATVDTFILAAKENAGING